VVEEAHILDKIPKQNPLFEGLRP